MRSINATIRSIDFFKANTITPSTPTPTLNHFVDGLNGYTSAPLVKGNSKLGSNVMIFDLPAIHTCMNCSDCAATCYAMKAQRQYTNTMNKRMVNWFRATYDTVNLSRDIVHQILTLKRRKDSKRWYVRIHSSGDFFNQAYVNLWNDIVKTVNARRSDIQFYYYTKVSHMLDFSELNSNPNVNMVESILPDGRVNYAPFEEVFKIAKKTGVYVCPYGNPHLNEELHRCGDNCTHCMHHKHVLFIKH